MKKIINLIVGLTAIGLAYSEAATTYTDGTGENIWSHTPADILSAEVSNNNDDLVFKVTVGGDITANGWANHMIAISTGASAGAPSGNAWNRPINFNSPNGGMNYWVGSWSGGYQLWTFNGTGWDGPANPAGSSYSNVGSLLTYTIKRTALGLTSNNDQTIYFDIYSSGGGPGDGAIDALSKATQTIANWGDTYSTGGGSGAGNALSYTVSGIPEPSSSLLMGLGLAGLAVLRRVRKNS